MANLLKTHPFDKLTFRRMVDESIITAAKMDPETRFKWSWIKMNASTNGMGTSMTAGLLDISQ